MNSIDWIGFSGVFLILLAYILNLSGRLHKDHITFILMNFIGAVLACLASVLMEYWPFIVLEGVWALASCIALVRQVRGKSI